VSVVETEALAAQLEAYPDYRVVRGLRIARVEEVLTGAQVSQAVVLDIETTGMDSDKGEVIELGLVRIEYDRETGAVGGVLAV